MLANEVFEIEGIVKEALNGGMYRVKLDDGPSVLSYVCGKMQKHHIRIVIGTKWYGRRFYEVKRTGDCVTVAFSPYDPKKGRIVYRAR